MTTRTWLRYLRLIQRLRREAEPLQQAADEAQRRLREHESAIEEARRMEFFARQQLQRELMAEEEKLAPLTGTDSRPEEGTRAHFDRYVAGDR